MSPSIHRWAAIAATFLAACDVGSAGPPKLSDDPAVIFSFPHDGQVDVPLGARLVVSFTDPVDASALGCTVDPAGKVSGGFCVKGPGGVLVGAPVVLGPKNNVIQFTPPPWDPATTYEVYAGPSLLWGKASNLVDGKPILRFTTTQPNAVPGQPPTVIAVNGDPPAAYAPGGGASPRFPFVDFSTIRLAMSEPLDATTVTYGDTVKLVDTTSNSLVDAALLVSGGHITVDPVNDLAPGHRYQLDVGAVLDTGGEPLAPVSFVFTPLDSRVNGQELAQVLSCIPGNTPSIAGGSPINHVSLSTPLIGDSDVAMKDSTLAAVMGNPAGFGPLIPLTLRKGQTLTMEALPVKLGGVIAMPLATGDLHVEMASDATVYLARNPFRDPARVPDDALSPVNAYLDFDVVVTAADPTGNAALNQQALGVQATGLSTIADGGLAIESVGALDLDLLGLDRATTNMVLRLGTTTDRPAPVDATRPAFMVAAPADGATAVAADAPIRVTFSEAIDPVAATEPGAVTLAGGATVPIRVTVDGTTLVVTPLAPLAYATDYTLDTGGAIRDLAGNAADSATIHFRTADVTTDSPAPLALAAVSPGAPCTLEGASGASPGRCHGGDGNDDAYEPFFAAADQPAEVTFTQPVDPSTVILGTACGAGSVRVERLDAGGGCVAAVPGRLTVGERTLRFVPAGGWQPGTRYQVVLHGGGNSRCDAGELCGRNGTPLNTDVLDGIDGSGDGGGADVVLPFSALATQPGKYAMTTRTEPVADGNGNGVIDAGEAPTDTNRAAMTITGTSGLVSSASFNGPDCDPSTPDHEACMYLSGALPVTMGSVQHDCTVGGAHVDACVPIELSPQILYGTELSMNAKVAVIGTLSDQRTDQLVLRMRTPDQQPIMSYIVTGANGPELRATLQLYLDAPSMKLLAGLAGHDLHSKPLTVDVAGPVTFTPDGRIEIALANTSAVPLSVQLSAIGIGIGTISMQIPAGGMKMQLVGQSPKGGW
jgi:hypothetical protein